MAENLESTLRRVAKLLAIAEDPRANAAEASAAAGMAERIMRKYQIDNADVISTELKRGGEESFASTDVGSTLDPEGYSKTASGWSGILAVAVAKLHDCQLRCFHTTKHGRTLRFSGYKADAEAARFTYVYLVSQMCSATRAYQTNSRDAGRSESEAFRRGFNTAVCGLLRKAMADKARKMQAASNSRDLVIVKENAVVKHFGSVKYRTSSDRTIRSGAYSNGYVAGSKVDVGRRGVGHNSTSRAQIGA